MLDQVSVQLGQNVKKLRMQTRISQAKLAEVLKVHQAAISRIESGSQNLLPWQLSALSKFFHTDVDSLLSGKINFWAIAKAFDKDPRVPKRYQLFRHSKVRELLPLIYFLNETKGHDYTSSLLNSLELDSVVFQSPDHTISTHCFLDLLRESITTQALQPKRLDDWITQTRTSAAQGFLHPIYETQDSSLNLIQTWILNAHHYESNFNYRLEELKRSGFTMSVAPAQHMKEISYMDNVLKNFICTYKKRYLELFPLYIKQKPIQLTERDCLFRGAKKCIYELKIA